MFQEAAKDRGRLKEVEAECRLLKDRLNRWKELFTLDPRSRQLDSRLEQRGGQGAGSEVIELVIREDGEDVTDIGGSAVNSLRRAKHQRSPGREGRSSSGDSRPGKERRKSLEIEKRRRSVEIQYGRESSDREFGGESAERDFGQEDGQKSGKMVELDSQEEDLGGKSEKRRERKDFGGKSREWEDLGGKRQEWDSRELAAAVAGQAAALAGLEQKMERIIGQVIFYQITNTN